VGARVAKLVVVKLVVLPEGGGTVEFPPRGSEKQDG
jgi:hypothetical protein